MVQFTGAAWAVPGVMVGSGKMRLLFGSFDRDELVIKDEGLPTSGNPPPSLDTRYAIYYVEVGDEEDENTWTEPVLLGTILGPDEYNLLYEVMQSIIIDQEGEPNA